MKHGHGHEHRIWLLYGYLDMANFENIGLEYGMDVTKIMISIIANTYVHIHYTNTIWYIDKTNPEILKYHVMNTSLMRLCICAVFDTCCPTD